MSEATEKVRPQLGPGKESLSQFDYGNTRYEARIPQGVAIDEMLHPSFWAHHGKDLRPGDEIRARAEDGTWLAYLYVNDCARTWARVSVLSLHDFSQNVSVSAEADIKNIVEAHEVKWRGPHKWSVVRRADSAVMVEAIEEKEKAGEWLNKYARDQVGAPQARVAA